jgi:hypothetical protein
MLEGTIIRIVFFRGRPVQIYSGLVYLKVEYCRRYGVYVGRYCSGIVDKLKIVLLYNKLEGIMWLKLKLKRGKFIVD